MKITGVYQCAPRSQCRSLNPLIFSSPAGTQVGQDATFRAGQLFARTEGIIPAPESSHAICSAINHALACKKTGEAKTIVFNLSGHGLLDLQN
ncbi:MAG: hypothetical protein WBZ29_03425 [Methanocella sp.]